MKTRIMNILITSIGFAIGGLIAGMGAIWGSYLYSVTGLNYYFRFNSDILDFIPFTIWGATGGLAVGIAAKEDKKLHALLGGVGFGAGLLASVFLGAWSSGIGVAGVVIGIFEGALLGFYYRNSKFVGIFAVCGVVGFGVGGIAGTVAYKVILGTISSMVSNGITVSLITTTIAFVVTGLVGGTALGYGVHHMQKQSKRV